MQTDPRVIRIALKIYGGLGLGLIAFLQQRIVHRVYFPVLFGLFLGIVGIARLYGYQINALFPDRFDYKTTFLIIRALPVAAVAYLFLFQLYKMATGEEPKITVNRMALFEEPLNFIFTVFLIFFGMLLTSIAPWLGVKKRYSLVEFDSFFSQFEV